ncbi:MAG: hypothetical protein ACLFSV_04160 [Alkalispirochaeta sp.]
MKRIDWSHPAPRRGLAGARDQLTGPGPEPAELRLQFGSAAVAAVAAGLWYRHAGNGSLLLLAFAVVMAFDIAGGVVTNATSTAKRWFHREGQGFREHVCFEALHLLHILVLALLFAEGDWILFGALSTALIASTVVILVSPLYLKRPVAMALYGAVVVVLPAIVSAPAGMEWFIPLFYLKLLIGHLLPEEPYRPTVEPANG